jgi:hypothetical protein
VTVGAAAPSTGEGGTAVRRRAPRLIATVLATLLLVSVSPATPALAANPVNRFLDFPRVKIGHGYQLSGYAYKSMGSFLLLQLTGDPQYHSGDFRGPKGAVRFSDSLRKVTIDFPLDGGFGKVVMSSKIPASAVKGKKVEGCTGKKYSARHALSGVIRFKTGSDQFGTIKVRDIAAKLTATSANFQCQPIEPPCPKADRELGAAGNDWVIDVRKANGKGRLFLGTYDQVTPNTTISHRVTAKVPGSAIQLTDDLSSGSVDATAADPDFGGGFTFSATAAGTTSPGDCGATYHYRDGELSGVGFHAEFDWGGSYYPFVGGPVMGGARRTEVP